MQLNNITKQMSSAITELRSALGKVCIHSVEMKIATFLPRLLIIFIDYFKAQEACGNLETDSALDMIQALNAELESFRKACEAFQLKPLPGESVNFDFFILC